MTEDLQQLIEELNERIKDAEVFICAARNSGLQQDQVKKLSELTEELAIRKNDAVQNNDENMANLLLGYECVTRALSSEILMWINLKQDDPDTAWDHLVSAQMASIDAVHAHEGFAHLEQHNRRLEALERLLFPPQVYVSSGMIVMHQECSICGQEYEDCEHLLGKPYMGKFCYIIAGDVELDHVAIVENPADKRCRVRHFDVEGGSRNRMTWLVEKKGQNGT